MTFASILFPGPGGGQAGGGQTGGGPPDGSTPGPAPGEPACFADLNLGQVVAEVTRGYAEYDLAGFFHLPLRTTDAVAYRHEVLRDLEGAPGPCVREFGRAMRGVRERLDRAARLHYDLQRQRWHLEAVAAYCAAVTRLAADLGAAGPRSRGLRAFAAYLAGYAGSPGFTGLAARAAELLAGLAKVSYSLRIRGNRVTVGRHAGERDYSADVTATFARFTDGEPRDYRVSFTEPADMNHVEAGVLALVARLFPEVFGAAGEFCARSREFTDPVVARFDREVHFYLAYLDHVGRLREAGLEFCYPQLSESPGEIRVTATFDLALAAKLAPAGTEVVRNDVRLAGAERILVVTGPNQGGKTTLARTFGQVHYLAGLGLLVPGADALLLLPDEVLTHFEKQERPGDLNGKLADDLARIRDILARATPRSVIVMNEVFTSTTLRDALFLARNVLATVIGLGAPAVFVTFLDEIAALGPATVSMVATVDDQNPERRTFLVVRRPADGLAYAMAVAAQHGLTYEQVRKRVAAP